MRKMGCLLLIIALLALAGCGQKPAAMPADTGNASNAAEGGANNGQGPAADSSQGAGGEGAGQTDASGPQQTSEQVKLTVKVYFTDNDLIELKPAEREIEVPKGQEDLKYEEAFKALQSADPGLISLWEKVKLNSAAFSEANGELALDIGAAGRGPARRGRRGASHRCAEKDDVPVRRGEANRGYRRRRKGRIAYGPCGP